MKEESCITCLFFGECVDPKGCEETVNKPFQLDLFSILPYKESNQNAKD